MPPHTEDPEDVTVHEAGHQFWYGVVATNEFEHAWMDEGINTFATARVMNERFAPTYSIKRYFGDYVPWVFRDFPRTPELEGDRLAAYRTGAKGDLPSTPSWRYWPGDCGSRSPTTRRRSGCNTLERMVGWDVLQRILSTYLHALAVQAPERRRIFSPSPTKSAAAT